MFNWWTFLFQTINFLVVLYILYRLFFKPLKNIIQTREESLQKRLEQLQAGEDELKKKEYYYQEKLKEIDWETIRSHSWTQNKEKEVYIRQVMMAEFLVYEKISQQHFEKIYCQDLDTAKKLSQKFGDKIEIKIIVIQPWVGRPLNKINSTPFLWVQQIYSKCVSVLNIFKI